MGEENCSRQEELVLNASSDITSSLKRTHTLLASELSRSQFATETLSQSTQALKELSNRYSTFDDMLLKSRKLITDLVRKNKSDAWYYEMAIKIMVITLVWLVIRRFFYGPFYLFIWLPLKLCWWALTFCGYLMGVGGDYRSAIIGGESIVRGGVGGEGASKIAINRPQAGVKGILENLPQIPESQPPVQQIAPDEPILVAGEKRDYRRPDTSPSTPFRENECSLGQQGTEAGAREEAEHDEL